jgi:NHLM bacteriocin system ABC transporter ATP-binding protein
MSEPENAANATVDDATIALRAGAAPVLVTSGTADVFAVDDMGVRFPIAHLKQGEYAFPATDPLSLLVVPRQGATLVSADPDTVGDSMLVDFVTAVCAQLGSGADMVSAAVPADLPVVLSDVITTAVAVDGTHRAAAMQSSLLLSQSMLDDALNRMAYSSESLRDPEVGAGTRLVRVLTILGHAGGFAISTPTPEAMLTTTDPLRLIAHGSGVRYRPVKLSAGWSSNATSNFLSAIARPGVPPEPVALLSSSRGYRYQRSSDPAPLRLTPEVEASIVPRGFEFYSPLTPDRAAGVRDVLRLGMRGSWNLWVLAAGMALGVALLGLLTPVLTNLVVGVVVPQHEDGLLLQIGLALAVAAGIAFVFSLVQNFTVSFISQRATRNMQSAFWDRVLSLPASFFRDYSSGDLAVRVLAVDTLQSLVSTQVVSAGLAAVFGMVNLVLMFKYNAMLGLVGLAFLLLTFAVLFFGTRVVSKYATRSLTASKSANGWLVQMLSGIMKIRIANAENRMESRYFEIARTQAVSQSQQTMVIGRISAWFVFAASGASALFYFVILLQWNTGTGAPIDSASYLAFASAYGLAFAAISGLTGLISPIANAAPTFNLLSPIMKALPETAGGRQDPGALLGEIELRDVVFRYTADGPAILKGLSLHVAPRTMVALVGPSGAGKSTITRQLLGFDTPESGQVLYDGRDLRDLDPTLVRSQMGVVVQEGQVSRGTILSNIVGAGSMDEDTAWAAAGKAALADDIRAMPMQMHTIVDPTNVSGGQAQRILLARALVSNPAILILDEATSALDNASQAQITQAMKELNATRIVIAHRLSTIRSADVIVVLDAGVVVETGTYDDLIALNGVFASLVTRQLA